MLKTDRQLLTGPLQLKIKIYGALGLILYSSTVTEIGTSDPSPGYEKAFRGIGSLIKKDTPEGTKLYKLYTQVPGNQFSTVMELYEPVDYLDNLFLQVVIPAILFPVIILMVLGWVMHKLVGNAQSDINYRNNLLSEFRQRLQKLLSDEAVSTLRQTTGHGKNVRFRIA